MDGRNLERKWNLFGWVLFVMCAGFFIASAVKSNDNWGLVGSIIFMGACVVFIIPLVTKGNRREDS
ncbi:MAG: cytochrome oxidase subunit III [Dehalococcoidales bacterium]